ncbi:MAG TPA: two-component regulator propeller domain-containing protein [Pyrinomonadaceae bacterium]|nr:two-component regulator propeller domain-containing protein [Pyrinomonadaceae bacterium]
MRWSFLKISMLSLAIVTAVFAAFQIYKINRSVQQTLAETRARLIDKNRVPFDKKILTPHFSNKVKIIQNTNETRAFVKFKDSFFAATSGGLVQTDEDGNVQKHFTVLDGLPESDLTALIVWNNKLFIGTRTKNLVTFDGERFENYVWTDRKAQTVTAFLERDGKLLIGTFAGGLLEFDGENFTEIKAENERINAVNCLYQKDAKLFVGTFNNGILIYQNDVWTRFSTTENLPSNRIVGIASHEKNLYAATDLGLAILEETGFRKVADLPTLASMNEFENKLFLMKDNGEIYVFDKNLKEFPTKENLQNACFSVLDDKLFLLSNQGIKKIEGAKIKPFSETENRSLTDNFVSALTFDKKQNLWIGTFRNGIDIFSQDGRKIKHFEDEKIREINFIKTQNETVSAATSTGLITFKNDLSQEIIGKNEGLPSNSVVHFSQDFTATVRGLAFQENGKIHAISAVNGLPNNAVYTVLQAGEKLYAGTLGGLAEIQNKKVVRTFKDSNSNLKTNWVTALISTNERICIGTYGGGLFELLPSGEIRSFETESGKFTVNPNAIFADENKLYIGTLEGAKIYDLERQKWANVKNILPSETVMAIAGDDENIYFGTTSGIAKIEKSYLTDEEER